MFSTLLENLPPFPSNLKLPSANSFSLEESKICRLGKRLTSTHHAGMGLLAFHHLLNLYQTTNFLDWSKLKAFADNKINATLLQIFVLGWVGNIVGKGENAGYQHFLLSPQCFQKASSSVSLTHYQTTNFRFFQTERVCRRQFQIWRKWQKVIQTGRKHCGKRRNCSLLAISPFPTVFSKGLFPRGVKRCHCVGMG